MAMMKGRFLVKFALLTALVCACSGGSGDGGDDDAPPTCFDSRELLASDGSTLSDSFTLVSDGRDVYWKGGADNGIMRVPVAGGESQFVVNFPCGQLVGVAGGYLYWTICLPGDAQAVMRRSVSGGSESLATPDGANVSVTVLTDDALFWSDESGIYRTKHSSRETTLVVSAAGEFSTDGESICWKVYGENGLIADILCTNVAAPTAPVTVYSFRPDPSAGWFLWEILVDDGVVYWIEQHSNTLFLLRAAGVAGGAVTELHSVGDSAFLQAHRDRIYWLEWDPVDESAPLDLYMIPKSGGSVVPVTADVDAFFVDDCHVYSFAETGLGHDLFRQPR